MTCGCINCIVGPVFSVFPLSTCVNSGSTAPTFVGALRQSRRVSQHDLAALL
jgi:hypothetical protein